MSFSPIPSRTTPRLLLLATMLLLVAASAQAQPTLSKVFTPDEIGPGSVSTITFTITNGSGTPVINMAFTDVLPAAVTIADPANASTTCSFGGSGSLSAPDGGSTITLTDAQVAIFSSCTVTVDVTSSTPGMHTNPAVTLTSSAGSSMSLPVDLTVDTDRPGFSKSFSPSSVSLGGRSTLTLTIDNTANASALSSISLTDDFPVGLIIADPTNASTDCGGPEPTLTAVAGGTSLSFSSFGLLFPGFEVLLAGETCTITADVVATAGTDLDNVTSELTTNAGSSGKASDTLEVTVTDLILDKKFTDDPTVPGADVNLVFTILNRDRDFPAAGVGFTDDLDSTLTGLTLDNLVSDDCGGSLTGLGTTLLSYSNGFLPAEGSCSLIVTAAVPSGAPPGSYVNTTTAVTGTVDGSPVVGNAATDTLFVEPVAVLTKEFTDDPVNPGETVTVEFTVTNTSATSSATDLSFSDPFPTVLPTASAVPGNDCCGLGSTCTFSPLTNPPPPSDVTPATFTLTGGTLQPAGMAGDSCTFTLTLDVAAGAAAGLYTNTTSAVSSTIDGATRVGDPATDDLVVVSAPRLSKTFLDDPVAPGDQVTLEFNLSHPPDAPGPATGITFTDDLATTLAGLTAIVPPSPDPPCGLGSSLAASAGDTLLTLMGASLVPGEECTFSVVLDVPVGAAADEYTNTTSGVSATVGGLATTSAPASDDLLVTGLTVDKEFIDDPVLPGEQVTLRFTLENIDPTFDATNIQFTDDLGEVLPGTPDLTVLTSLPLAACGGTLSALGGDFLLFSGGSALQGDPPCSFDVLLEVPAGAVDGFYINTTGTISATIDGSTVFLDPVTDGLTIESDFLQLTKEFVDDPVAPGDSATIQFTLNNLDGAQSASSIEFTDDLGAALPGLEATGLPFAACGGTVDVNPDAANIRLSGATLGPGAECQFDVSVDVPGGAVAGTYLNTTSDVTGMMGGFPVSGDPGIDTLTVLDLLDFSKSFDGPTTATRTATLTFTLTNPGNETATDIDFTDDLDAVIPGLIATSLPSLPCGAGSSITGISFLAFSGGELPPMGGTCSFDVEVLVPATAAPGNHPNVTSDLVRNGLTVAPPATADLVIEPPPAFSKAFMPDAIFAGGVSTLRFTIDNSASTFPANALGFTDNLPAGVVIATPPATSNTCGGTLTAVAASGSITLVDGSVGAGATCTIDVNVTSIVSGAHLNTTGDLTSTSGNSGTASDTLNVTSTADLSVTKTDGVTTATPGASVIYTIAVANAGPSADPSVGLADAFPSPPLTCTYTSVATGGATGNTAAGAGELAETLSMPAGSSVTYTATCAIDSDATGTLSNTATVTPSVNDMVPGNNSATDNDTVLLPSADLAITKTDGVTSAVPGQTTLTYTIVASNGGLSDDPSVSVTDSFPAALTCTYTSVASGGATGNTAAGAGNLAETLSMPAGSSVTYTTSCTIDPAATGTLSNTATISGSVDDPNAGNNSATDNDTVLTPEADLSVTKTDGVTSAIPGQTTLTYTVVVANGGPSVDPAASLTDAFPASLTCTYTSVAAGGASGNTAAGAGDLAETLSLPVASSVTYTASCTIDPAATGTLSNTATVTASVTDPVPGNDSATDGDTVLTPEADLSIVKSTDVITVTVGDTIDYDLEVTNDGPSAATGILLDDPTPTGLVFETADAPCAGGFPCALNDLGPGGSVTITATFMVPFDYAGPAQITNTATVSADTTDNNAGNDSDTVMTDVEFDSDPPAVTAITTVNGPLAACDDLRQPVSGIAVTIEDTNSPIVGADLPGNYLLVGSGPDGDFTTASCAGGPAGDDEAVTISSVAVDDTDPLAVTATPSVAGPQGLAAGLYRFFVCGTIEDEAGNSLEGGDFEIAFFRANPLNLFVNGHFDDCPSTLDPWTPATTPPNAVQTGVAGADDFEGSPLSASAQFVQTDPASSSLGQCVAVDAQSFYDFEAWLRYDAPLGALAVYEQVCEFFDAAACGGTSLGEASLASLLEDVGPVWSFSKTTFATPAGAASALCRFETGPLGSDPVFNLYLDGLFLGGTTDPEIFSDGFESGDTSAWSITVP